MILIGLERIIAQGRIWFQDAYLKIKEVGSSVSSLSPSDNFIHIYVKDKSGTATPYWKDDGDTEHEFADAATVPPINADYLVKTSNATLTAERVVTDTTSITVDWATAGQAKFVREALTGDVTASQNSNATTIANDAVTNAKMADMAAWTVKARNNAGSGDPQDVALADLTEEASPANGDFVIGFLDTGELRKFDLENLPYPESGGSGSASGHVHSLTRLVADGSATTFNLLDIVEYLDAVTDDGVQVDALDYTLSSDGSQVTIGYTVAAGNVLQFNGVAASL
jgi:hypothetical protein